MRRVNNFNKKKKKSLRRGEQPRRAIRFASKHARPDLRPRFLSSLRSPDGGLFRVVSSGGMMRHGGFHFSFGETKNFLSPSSSFLSFPFITFFFPTIRGSCSERTKFLNYRTCDTPLFKMNLYRLVWNGGTIYMYCRFWIDFCSNEKESEPVLLQKIFLIIIIKI